MEESIQGGDWRSLVPERFRGLTDHVTTRGIGEIFGYTQVYVRRLRQRRLNADNDGTTTPLINALPSPIDVFQRPMYWRTYEILQWGIRTGRIDPVTGAVRKLPSSGRPRGKKRT